jgi:2-polyprenyl-3-methyl-5-hydroxy-6-metoxy-1,4-benzoquinol methylase
MAHIDTWESAGNVHIDMNAAAQTLPYHRCIAALALAHAKPDAKILDLGCGRGQILGLIKHCEDLKFFAADAYQSCLDETAQKMPLAGQFLIDEASFNIDKIITENGFDLIIFSHVLEHLRNPIEALEKTMRLLKPGGILIVAVPNPVRPNILISNIFQKHYVNRGHVHAWDMSHWRNFLERINNLEVIHYAHDFIQIPGCYRFPILQTLGEILAKIVPWWSFSNIAVIRKGPV